MFFSQNTEVCDTLLALLTPLISSQANSSHVWNSFQVIRYSHSVYSYSGIVPKECTLIHKSMYCIQQVPQVLISPTNEGASGMSRDGFFIVRVDSLRVGIFAGFACFKDMGSSAVPLRGVVGVVVSAFLLTPFLTCQVKKKCFFISNYSYWQQ